jgi:YD repeat-containing protein
MSASSVASEEVTTQRAIHREWREVLGDLGIAPDAVGRNVVPHRECTWAGAIDVASGKVVLSHRDFALGAAPALAFDRIWISSSSYAGPLGHGWHHAFDVALAQRGNTVAIRGADGRVLWFAAPALGREVFQSTEQLRLSRDTYGFRLRDGLGCELRFVPHRSQQAYVLSAMRPHQGLELRFGYDQRARLARITCRGARQLELEYDRADRLIAIHAAAPQRGAKPVIVARYAYDLAGNLARATDALGGARTYVYARQLMMRWTDRTGCATRFEWDRSGLRARCVRASIESDQCVRKLEYEEQSTTLRDSVGRAVEFVHNGSVVHRSVDARGRVCTSVRGEGGRVVREVDSLGQDVTREYDELGRLVRQCSADGATWSFDRDAHGRIVCATDPIGGRWRLTYDSRGRVVRRVDPLGRVTRYQYRGRWLVAIGKPGDRVVRYAYDDAGELASCTEPDGQVTSCEYDAWGRRVRVLAPDAAAEERSYDALGRLVRIGDAEAGTAEISYDGEGRMLAWKDGFREIHFTYDTRGLLSSRTEAGLAVCFDYDSEARLIAITNEAGRVFRIERDAVGAIVETSGFDGCERRYVRDAHGWVTRVERAGAFSEYEYDRAGRPIEVHHSDGAFEGYCYRRDGALLSAWNQGHSLAFEHDACGQVIRQRDGASWIESQFDVAGCRTALRSSFGLDAVFERDASGRVRRIVERRSGFELHLTRDARGRVVERASPERGRCVLERDALGRPTVARYEAAAGRIDRELRYAWEGRNLRARTDSCGPSAEYGYDARGNLTWCKSDRGIHCLRAVGPTGESFHREDRRDREYGPAGQLLVRATRSGDVSYVYDAAGQLIERREPGGVLWRFAWSASGLLGSVCCPDGSDVTFGYDALGRRIWKKHRGEVTRFAWDGERVLHEWLEGGAVTTWLYDPDDGSPVAKLAGGEVFLAWLDVVGEGAPHDLFDGPSMYEDAETGLFCESRVGLPARYFDPVAGSYLCQGALAVAPSLRPYAHSFAFGVEWAGPEDAENAGGVAVRLVAAQAGAATISPSDTPPVWVAPAHALAAPAFGAGLPPSAARTTGTLIEAPNTAAASLELPQVAGQSLELPHATAASLAIAPAVFTPTKCGPRARPVLAR